MPVPATGTQLDYTFKLYLEEDEEWLVAALYSGP